MAVDLEIDKLLEKGVISESQFEEGQFVSNIFTSEKKDGGHRIMLDLSQLNEYIAYVTLKWIHSKLLNQVSQKIIAIWLHSIYGMNTVLLCASQIVIESSLPEIQVERHIVQFQCATKWTELRAASIYQNSQATLC